MREPSCLAYSLEKLQKGHQHLAQYGLNQNEILYVYIKFPRILGLNLDTPRQRQKTKFFETVVKVRVDFSLTTLKLLLQRSVKDVLMIYPHAYSASLTRKLMVRHAYFLSSPSPPHFNMTSFINPDEAFCKLHKFSLSHFKSFATQWQATRGKVIEKALKELDS